MIEGQNVLFAQLKKVKSVMKIIFFKEIELEKFNSVQWSPCGRFLYFISPKKEQIKFSMHNCYGKAI